MFADDKAMAFKAAGVSRRAAIQRIGCVALFSALPAALHASPAISDGRQRTTAALIRTAFPHDRLDDAFYADIARRYLDELAPAAVAQHDRGLAELDGSMIGPFAALPQPIQRSLVERIDQQPFFKALLWRCAELIYRDRKLWAIVGYEGSAFAYGGYRDRGFDDIDWLPSGTKTA
ncbi:hypothetical protein [Flavisphingomonas formosensis]|uniref:hypothetical protein n=1 Tax=Flavisphingomonas formosensis TaxID=861534 RepID=UPI0012F711A5|nr:hypothetical protein [Sphingomonas formosensis]